MVSKDELVLWLKMEFRRWAQLGLKAIKQTRPEGISLVAPGLVESVGGPLALKFRRWAQLGLKAIKRTRPEAIGLMAPGLVESVGGPLALVFQDKLILLLKMEFRR